MDPPEDLDPDSVDPGEPLRELVGLAAAEETSFFDRLRAKIERRVVAAQSMDFVAPVFLRTCLEYLSMLFTVFSGEGESRKDRKG